MDYASISALSERHAAWRLLRAHHAPLVLSFLGDYFVEQNRGPMPASEVTAALDEVLFVLNDDGDQTEPRFPKAPSTYLEDWSAVETPWLRRFYPATSDEVHYEVTPAFVKAWSWVQSLQTRAFVGTESRLHIAVELLRQIVHGTEVDPEARLAELRRRRAEIDAEISQVEAGQIDLLGATGVRDRYQQFAATAREILADFREVEENFRRLDRTAREKIAIWNGSKGELLADLVGSRSDIARSDQGRSFHAFYDFLLSESRQEEFSRLLARAAELDDLEADRRLRHVHHDWSEAAERAQHTVRQISEQLRRFLDEQVWLENRRVLALVRSIEAGALAVRTRPPEFGLEVDLPGLDILLPFERPLYESPPAATVEGLQRPEQEADVETDALFDQAFVDRSRLVANIMASVPPGASARLADILELYPVELGAAEVVGYLAIEDDGLHVELDETERISVDYADPDDPQHGKRLQMPQVSVRRT